MANLNKANIKTAWKILDTLSTILIGSKTIDKLLVDPFSGEKLWTSTPSGEKNYQNSPYIRDLLETKCNGLFVNVGLRIDCFIWFLKTVKYFVFMLLKRARSNAPKDRALGYLHNQTVIITYQDRLKPEASKYGLAHDHFSSFDFLDDYVSRNKIFFVHIDMNNLADDCSQLICDLNQATVSPFISHISLSESVSTKEIFKSFLRYLRIFYPICVELLIKGKKVDLPDWVEQDRRAKYDLLNSLLGPALLKVLLTNIVWEKFFVMAGNPEKIIYPFENLYWEHALLRSTRKRFVKTFGVIQGTVSEFDLRYAFRFGNKTQFKDFLLPDVLGLNSSHLFTLFDVNIPLVKTEAVRYEHLSQINSNETIDGNRTIDLLVLGDCNRDRSLEMINLVRRSVKFKSSKVIVKMHAACHDIEHEFMDVSQSSALGDLLRRSKFVFVSNETGALIDCLYLKDLDKIMVYSGASINFSPYLKIEKLNLINNSFDLDTIAQAYSDHQRFDRSGAEHGLDYFYFSSDFRFWYKNVLQ